MNVNKPYLDYISDKIRIGKTSGLSSYYKLDINFDYEIVSDENITLPKKLNLKDLNEIADDIRNNNVIEGTIKVSVFDKSKKINIIVDCFWNLEVDETQIQENLLIFKNFLTLEKFKNHLL